jgi:RES domain-containing protein
LDAYRIGSSAYPLLDGAGAARSDSARWNSKGRHVIYAAEHYATAVLEKAAQLNSLRIPRSLVYVRIHVPRDISVEEVQPAELAGWDSDRKTVSRSFGDRWYDEQRSLVLLVPSLIAPGIERNVLINESHSEFRRVTSSHPESIRCHPNLLV